MNTNLKKLQDNCYNRIAHNLVRLDNEKLYDLIIVTCAGIAKNDLQNPSDAILKHFGLKNELQPLE